MILPPENPYGHTKKLRYFLHELKPLEGTYATVLDFGCGNGTAVTQYLSSLFLRVVGVEHDPDCLEYSKRTLPCVQVYSTMLALEPESFEAIICSDVLEHLLYPVTTLLAFGELLKPNGFIIGSIPNGHGLFELENRLYRSRAGLRLSQAFEILLNPWRLFRPKRSDVPYNNDSPHVQFFSLDEFFDLVDEAGFYISDFRNGTLLGSPPITAHILEKSQWLMNMNGYVADHLKPRYASTWLFKLVKK